MVTKDARADARARQCWAPPNHIKLLEPKSRFRIFEVQKITISLTRQQDMCQWPSDKRTHFWPIFGPLFSENRKNQCRKMHVFGKGSKKVIQKSDPHFLTPCWTPADLLGRFWPIFGPLFWPLFFQNLPDFSRDDEKMGFQKWTQNGSKNDLKSGFPKMHFLRIFLGSLIRLFSVHLFSSFFHFLSPSPNPDRDFSEKSWPQKWHFFRTIPETAGDKPKVDKKLKF